MMISHYHHLMEVEGMPFGKEMIIRGSLERLAPVMMTAMTSFIGLIPLLFGYGEPGGQGDPLSVVGGIIWRNARINDLGSTCHTGSILLIWFVKFKC